MQRAGSVWASRFIAATFVLGGIAWIIIAVLLVGNVLAGLEPPNYVLGPASSRIAASGGPGTWFVMGLLSYLVIGIVGIGLSAMFYRHVEADLGSPLTGGRSIAAWIHLILGSVGAAGASLLMVWGGFQAGGYMLAPQFGGGCEGAAESPQNLGPCIGYVHTNFLSPIVLPIAILMAIALLGYLVGGLGLVAAWWKARKPSA